VQALGGAKNHMVVMPDAVVDETVKGLIGSGFGAAGQRCMAGSVVVTVGDAYDRVVPPLVDATKALKVGDGLEESNDVGPVISDTAQDRINGWIDKSDKVLVDGREGVPTSGCFVGPTIVEVDGGDEIIDVEVFGPLLSIVRVDTLDDAIAMVNRSPFGNGVSIFTESGAAVRKFKHDVEVGMVGVNIGVAAPVAFFPFSGWKASFLGDLHAHGPDAVEFYTRKKTITTRYFSETDSGRYFVEN
jgi:malonate-semialdehyde dehydrogenase (acetylating)/methylmalonate-semialdehyde dehydrogenase